MVSATQANSEDVIPCDDLKAIQAHLETLAKVTKAYPLECSLGTYALLFDSKDDIEVLLESLAEEISESRVAT